jgi:hypothetical protein
MNRAFDTFAAPRRSMITTRAFAGVAAALACAAAAESTAILTNKLLTDGALVAAACAVARLAVWMAQALRQAMRTAVAP